MEDNKLTIFLSHSHKDIDKVRKVRDILEILECEPLMFYLKCMDEDTGELSDLLKREIRARNVFLYCRSRHAEQSRWVQEEVSYIRSLPGKRLYTIDIDKDFSISMVEFLQELTNIVKANQLFFSYAHQDEISVSAIRDYITKNGYKTFIDTHDLTSGSEWAEQIAENIENAARNGIFLAFITEHSINSPNFRDELNYAIRQNAKILPVFLGDISLPPSMSFRLGFRDGLRIPENFSSGDMEKLLQAIRTIQ